MKKTRVWILAVVIAVILIIVSIWVVGYRYLSNRIDNSTRQSFIDESELFLLSDDDFKNEYGTLISMESEDQMPVKNDAVDLTEYYMDFICTTSKGEFNIRVYHTWNDGWSFKYEDLQSN